MWKFREVWFILLLGLFLTSNRCESRAVNISNTWTLPQEGFTVFYRFFRDQISWFEADAVCQFHHANLVTVEDSMQFDATRDFLKVLDVTELVWIGLMRAQNSKRFAWSNSKPLPSESGYWAEPLPVIESPLCAVIDPVRDFRWHALRCGGPETASFLCEMNVPSWAEECTLRDIPSLTIQYMADSGSVELSKDCGEEGTIHQICRGKQDRDRILKELVCKNERNTEINQNSITSTDLADTHYKSLQIIQNIPSDNNEDNNIREKLDKVNNNDEDDDNNDKKEPEQNPVQKLIEQFNVEELMQADQPQQQQMHRIPDEIRKPVKKTLKKAKSFEKKDRAAKKMKSEKDKKDKKPPQDIPLEDMMMGDQPSDSEPNDVKSPFLPHMKKSFPDDLLQHEVITTVTSTSETNHEPESTFAASSTELTEKSMISSAGITVPPPVETKTGTIGHPMHPQQPRLTPGSANPIEETNLHPVHIKETSDNHFIPPMLLVKSHYTSTKSHTEGDTSIHHPADLTTIRHEQTSEGVVSTSTTTTTTITTISGVTEAKNHLTTQNATIVIPTSILDSSTTSTAKDIKQTTDDKVQVGSSSSSTTFEPPSTEHQIVEIKLANTDSPTTTFSITTRSIPSGSETSEHGSSSSSSSSFSNTMKPTEQEQNLDISSFHHDEQRNEFPQTIKHDTNSSPAAVAAATGPGTITATTTTTTSGEKSESKEDHHPKVKNKFSNEENFQPYKPNRRRSLTKPETTTYLKKILG